MKYYTIEGKDFTLAASKILQIFKPTFTNELNLARVQIFELNAKVIELNGRAVDLIVQSFI